jgi:hypothetical protein
VRLQTVRPTNWANPFFVRLSGPFARIALSAEGATKTYKPFGPEDVTEEMRAPVLTVTATGANPQSHQPYVAKAVLLLPIINGKAAEQGIQPVKAETFPETWGNRLGAKLEGQGIVATFPLDKVPAGDFFVVVVAENARETRYQIKADLRPNIW